ncbi:hypothetical protein EXIGLDRAFT_726734 [Exidia glandulosa HHB12029]|uniref:Uncharacterized protein n=1 Tax=Exidia glandulosa HHB12029 TaxID=1314781 RepID=A0A165DL48_EXIGL|nr:hypothetical protein EXIGLDRAFT_726734 [Exidia glandulosa HHB12029]
MHTFHNAPGSAAPTRCIPCNASLTQEEWNHTGHVHQPSSGRSCYHRRSSQCALRHLRECESCRRMDASPYS